MSTPPQPISDSPLHDTNGNGAANKIQDPPRFSTPPPADNWRSPKAGVKPLNPTAIAHQPAPSGSGGGGAGANPPWAQEEQMATPVPQPFQMNADSPSWNVNNSPSAAQQHGMSPGGITEVEYHHTRNLIGVVQRPALVAVLQSIMDDFPQLAPLIRVRCEKAMSVVMQQQQQQQQQPQMHSPWGGAAGGINNGDLLTPPKQTPSGRRHSGARGGEEQMMCGVHGNLRATKHLKFNPTTRMYECIPGFHCLENSREASTAPSPAVISSHATPTKREVRQERTSTGGTPPPGIPYLNTGGAPASASVPLSGGDGSEIDITKLENLLSNLRKQ